MQLVKSWLVVLAILAAPLAIVGCPDSTEPTDPAGLPGTDPAVPESPADPGVTDPDDDPAY